MPDPVPGPGQILLKVKAAGVNYVDIMRRRGDPLHEPTPLPAIVGYEMAGTVAGLGTGVTLPMLGARVFVNARSGAYAQYALAPAESAIEIPAGMDPIKIVALWLQGLTAALALRHAGRVATGETVLVEAAGRRRRHDGGPDREALRRRRRLRDPSVLSEAGPNSGHDQRTSRLCCRRAADPPAGSRPAAER
ncbi:MAG: quinone oxidoreductase family protein, partial [Candidatus Binataceae bacterium]